jgi:hypothetical protein
MTIRKTANDRRTGRTSEEIELYRCTECGKISVSRGYLHGHIEKHQGFGPFNIIPDPRKTANPDALDEKTEVLTVTEYEVSETVGGSDK